MPDTGQITPKRTSGSSTGFKPVPSVVRGKGALGDLRFLARAVLERSGLVLVVPSGWAIGAEAAEALFGALDAVPDAAFAFGEIPVGPVASPERGGAVLPVDAEFLTARPFEPGPIALRVSEAARLGWPEFGPPDLILDAAATWALATALAVRGGRGVFVSGARATQTAEAPEAMPRLRPEGIAWLASCALSWTASGRPAPDLAERLWRRWTGELSSRGFEGLTPPKAAAP